MEAFRRKKRLFLGLAAGAASAAAAYYWWAGYTHTKLQQQRSMEMELSAILRGETLSGPLDDGALDGSGETDGEGDECGSPDLDESLDRHFKYIQKVSTPQEISELLPRIKEALERLTDIKRHQQQQQLVGGPEGAQQQLRLLARLCFGRTVAAAFLLPLIDLCVRTKLNIIGRHLFLQEKFSKLRQPAAPAARMRLPPRLTAAAVETFLSCDHLAGQGCAWLVEQAMLATDAVLERVPLEKSVTPEELAGLVQAVASTLGQTITASAATSRTGSAWVDALVSPSAQVAVAADAAAASGSAEAYRRALTNAGMVEELQVELRRVLNNYRFIDALHAAVGQCLSTCAAHIHATFISQAAAAHQQQQQQQRQQETMQQQQQPATASPAPTHPPPSPSPVISPFSAVANSCPSDSSSEDAPPLPQQQPGQTSATEVQSAAPAEATPTPERPLATAPSTSEPSTCGDGAAAAPPATPPAANISTQRSGSGGGARACLAAAAVAAMQPRPLARCLRAVRDACEPLFVDAREVSARIACLTPVMSLCAVAFAAPLEL